MKTEVASVAPQAVARQDRVFHIGMALACLLTVVIGFGPTYFYKPFHASPPLPTLLHVHGLAFTCWLLLFLLQSALVRTGRVALHMRLGIFGGCLASVMVILGIMVAIDGVHRGTAADGMDPLGFMIFPFGQVLMFAGFIGTGLWQRRQPEVHRRLMLLVTISLLTPAISRMVDKRSALAAMLTLGFVVVAMIHDWRTRGRVHSVYIWGGAIMLVLGPLRAVFGHSAAWHAIARVLSGT
jgi:hypothetical protein